MRSSIPAENASSGATLAPILAEIAWEQGKGEQAQSLLVPRLETIDNFCPPDGLSRGYIILARQAVKWGDWRKPNHYYCMPKGWRPSAAGCGRRLRCWPERIAVALHAGDKLAARRAAASPADP